MPPPVIWPVPGSSGAPPPRPQPQQTAFSSPDSGPMVVQHRFPVSAWLPWVLAAAIVLIVIVTSGVVVALTLRPTHQDPDGVKLGRVVAKKLAPALAKGFRAYVVARGQGKTCKQADDELKRVFHDEREKAFAVLAGPAFNEVVPDGAEPTDPDVIARDKQLHLDFAKGLEEAP